MTRAWWGIQRGPRVAAGACLSVGLAVLLGVAGPAPARAQSDDGDVDVEQARAHFELGVRLIQQGRWVEAARELEAARRIRATAPVLYNLGIAQRGVGHVRAAIDSFRSFLEVLGDGASPERRAEVEGYITELEGALSHLDLRVEPAGAIIQVDGDRVSPTDGSITLDPGRHRVRITAEGYAPVERSVQLDRGERGDLSIQLERALGRLHVESTVEGARVIVDGDDLGAVTVDTGLPPGRHVVEVRADGHEPYRREVDVAFGEVLRLNADLSSQEEVWESPWLWVGIGAAVIAGVVLTAVLTTSSTEEPYVGDLGLVTGVLLEGP